MSTLTVSNIKKTGETASRDVSGVAAAWARFDMISDTVNGSLNIGNIIDNATGDFTLEFSSDMASENYAHVGSAAYMVSATSVLPTSTLKDGSPSYATASNFRGEAFFVNSATNRTNFDYDYITATIHGDLA